MEMFSLKCRHQNLRNTENQQSTHLSWNFIKRTGKETQSEKKEIVKPRRNNEIEASRVNKD